MFHSFGEFVSHRWRSVIAAWVLLVVVVRLIAPQWDSITHDGDLAFLPANMPSVQGERLARAAFPGTRAKSEIVVVVGRADRSLDSADWRLADRLTASFYNQLGAVEYNRAQQLLVEPEASSEVAAALESALAALSESIKLNDQLAEAWHNRGIVCRQLRQAEEARLSQEAAWQLAPELRAHAGQVMPVDALNLPLVEIWNRHHEVFGAKLRSADRRATIIVLRIANEFMATDNIRVLHLVEREILQFRQLNEKSFPDGLEFGISGSAAVGGDMLSAAAESIRNTEWLTIALVVTILLLVYRAPLLVLVPIVTIGVSLSISIGLLSLLTQLHWIPGFSWFGFKVFKTTKIFIIVILYGSGTNFCLFLLARLREELAFEVRIPEAVGLALGKVGDAILASGLTTILGLAMMFFADFGKFRNSGPAIGLCLLVTLAACMTLAPALLCAFGCRIFWPLMVPRNEFANSIELRSIRSIRPMLRAWQEMTGHLVRFPARILFPCVLLLTPMAICGFFTADHVTFDFLSELPPNRTTIRGNQLLQRHFPVGEGGPVVVLARRNGAGFDSSDEQTASRAMAGIFDLTEKLSKLAGVESVRSLAEPLGDTPKPISLVSSAGRRKLMLREHRLTKSLFLSQTPEYRGETTRFELVLRANPFSLGALETLARIDVSLKEASELPDSFWHGTRFVYTGATAGIRDLRGVTESDYWRIQVLVTLAVLGVLVFILRRPGICVYLITSVLFSYFVTIGATELFFGWFYGDTFHGLDWKVPIFLFVILVAVGEDYNIYLVTRVFEEQSRMGPFGGLREGILRTGGVITSCGVIMAGSFVSMLAGSLRGIVELGFALTIGILLDTFIVRTILVSTFLSLVARWQVRRSQLLPYQSNSIEVDKL